MRSLVVYYSRTGITKKVAESISARMSSDIEVVVDKTDRSGPKVYFSGGRDAITKKLTEIQAPAKDPSDYDIVILGTPVWALTMAPAIRSYIAKNKDRFRKVAFFATQGGGGRQNKFEDMEELCGKKPEALLDLKSGEVKKEIYEARLGEFIEMLRNAR